MRWTCQHGSIVEIAGNMAVSDYLCSRYVGSDDDCYWVAVEPIRPEPGFEVTEVVALGTGGPSLMKCVHEWRVIDSSQSLARNSYLYTFYCVHCLETKAKAV
jgi:hypothetical protein